jgi:hypothetical protein
MAYTTIDDPSAYFQALVFTGTGGDAGASQPTTHTNTGNSDLQPDFIWFKDKGATYQHYLVDSSRGRAKGLHSDDNSAETTTGSTSYDLVSFDSDGFKVGLPSEGNSTNGGTTSKVAWQWKASGGTTASNTDGTITSTVQANTTAGFSIITYTGTGSAGTIGHGLGVTPDIIIFKRRDGTNNWDFQFKGEARLTLNLTDAQATNVLCTFTSTTTDLGSTATAEKNANTGTYVAYAFAEKQGYSKFGKYTGNSHSGGEGPFVYTGFAPSFIIIKRTDAANDWIIHTYKLGTLNGAGSVKGNVGNTNTSAFRANENSVVNQWGHIDMLSNGFKVRSAGGASENATAPYIYMAFAEHPFVTSTGIPTTAR